jgi:hypothetical protein
MAEKKDEKKATNQKAGPFPSPTPEEKLVRETDRLKGERAQAERMEKNTAQEGESRSSSQAPAPTKSQNKGSEGKQDAGEPVPPAGSSITIEGDGTTPIIGVDGKVRTVERGVPIEVSDEEVAYLKTAGLPFKTGKKQ